MCVNGMGWLSFNLLVHVRVNVVGSIFSSMGVPARCVIRWYVPIG